jgi:hypothetical protein
MISTPDPFLAAEMKYRQLRAIELYDQHSSSDHRRRRWVPRRPSLTLPHPRRRPATVA